MGLFATHHDSFKMAGGQATSDEEEDKKMLNRRLSLVFSIIATAFPMLALIGWIFDITFLKQTHAGFPAMQPNTAIGLILSGISVFLLNSKTRSLSHSAASCLSASLVILLGAMTLLQYFISWDFGIDQIFVDEPPDNIQPYPGRPSPQASGNFVLLGTCLILYNFSRYRAGQLCLIAMAANAIIAVTGYVFGSSQLYGFPLNITAIGMAIHTALSFLFLAAALLYSRPNVGVMTLFTSDTRSGSMARKILLVLFLAPLLVGALTRLGVTAGWYGVSIQASYFTLIIVGLAFWQTWVAARQSEQEEVKAQKAMELREQALAEREAFAQRISILLEQAPDGIFVADLDGRYVEVNRVGCEMLGYRHEELIGKHITDLIHPDDLHRLQEDKNHMLKGEPRVGEWELRKKDGSYLPVEVSAKILPDGRWQGFVRDISERKKAQKRLQDYAEKLRKSNQELDDFVYIVSHDLKEPLRGLYSFSQFLEEDYRDRLDDEGKDKLDTIKTLAMRMENLIETLLYYSRVGRDELSFAITDLNDALEKALDLLAPMIEKNNVTINVKPDLPAVYCDKARIGEVFYNLITNAIKYNDSAQKYVELGCTKNHIGYEGKNVFYVADNGIGIDEHHRDIVFQMFKRLHGGDAYGGGTGSGLAIVKKIIDRHKGRIWIETNAMGGTTFYFTLEKT